MKNLRTPEFDLEAAVAEWSRGLRRSGGIEDGTIAELAGHVKDEVEDRVEQGQSPEDAFREAIAAVESPEAIGGEYVKSDSRGFLPPLFMNSLKVSVRKMRRQKWYSLINIGGLAVGMACSLLILLWVRSELSHDRFHRQAKSIYRVIMDDHRADGVETHSWLPFPLGPALKKDFPEIAAVTRWAPEDMVVRYKDESHTEMRFLTVDPAFFTMFSFPFIEGSPDRAFPGPASIVIRDTVVEKYFKGENPIGKVLNLSDRADLSVTGIVHIPDNSDFQYDFFFTFDAYPLFGVKLADYEADWGSFNYQFYVLLKDGVSADLLEKKIAGFLKPRLSDRERVLRLQPLSRIHLYQPDGSDGAMRYVRIFSLIAGIILLIACVNFMNLSTARSESRAKEVGLRKTLGSTRGQLIRQFFAESLLHAALALGAALLIAWSALPFFSRITGRPLGLDLGQAGFLGGMIAIALGTGLVAGFYPALFLSSFPPARAVKRMSSGRGRSVVLRKSLVVLQFALSTVLIVGTLVVNSQVAFIMNRDLGLAKDTLVTMRMQKKSRDSVDAVRTELLKHPGIAAVSSASQLPFDLIGWIGYLDWEGRPDDRQVYFSFMSVDPDFARTCGLTFLSGRDFSRDIAADADRFIINETARRQMGLENPIGRQLDFLGRKGQIIGVVRDFTNRHLAQTTAPLVLTMSTKNANRSYLLLRLQPGDPSSALTAFRQVWAKINPGFPCEPQFADESFSRMYVNERRLARLFLSFAVLAVFISCLGLVGLSSFLAEEKTKEIGIRKALGASSGEIVSLFSLSFLRLVAVANVIAAPVGYLIMRRWLQGFAFRTTIEIQVFLLAGAIGLLTALLSVGGRTFRVSTANPADSLRYE